MTKAGKKKKQDKDPVAVPVTEADDAAVEEQAADAVILTEEELATIQEEANKAAEFLDLAQRTAAELQNLQNRLGREKETARKLAVRDLLRALLPSFDNLDRALMSGESQDAEAVIEGVRLVAAEIHRILEDRGLEVLDPVGQKLDPTQHEAVFSRPDPDAPDGTVVETFEKGYRMSDLIIRPARVIVAAAPAPEVIQEDATADAEDPEGSELEGDD